MYIDILLSACVRSVGVLVLVLFRLLLVWLAVPLVPCRLALLSVAVAIWCNRATMRYNRSYVFGGVVLPCALLCDSGAFYKRLLCVVVVVRWSAVVA